MMMTCFGARERQFWRESSRLPTAAPVCSATYQDDRDGRVLHVPEHHHHVEELKTMTITYDDFSWRQLVQWTVHTDLWCHDVRYKDKDHDHDDDDDLEGDFWRRKLVDWHSLNILLSHHLPGWQWQWQWQLSPLWLIIAIAECLWWQWWSSPLPTFWGCLWFVMFVFSLYL